MQLVGTYRICNCRSCSNMGIQSVNLVAEVMFAVCNNFWFWTAWSRCCGKYLRISSSSDLPTILSLTCCCSTGSGESFDADPTVSLRAAWGGCGTGNPVDDCWRCDPNWASHRQSLANCAIGFGRNAIGGKNGRIYVVTSPADDDVANPRPGTLRYALTRLEPLWSKYLLSLPPSEKPIHHHFHSKAARDTDLQPMSSYICFRIQKYPLSRNWWWSVLLVSGSFFVSHLRTEHDYPAEERRHDDELQDTRRARSGGPHHWWCRPDSSVCESHHHPQHLHSRHRRNRSCQGDELRGPCGGTRESRRGCH